MTIRMDKLEAMLKAEAAVEKHFKNLSTKEERIRELLFPTIYNEISGHADKGNKGGKWNLEKAQKYAAMTDKDAPVSRAKMRRAAHLASLHCLAAGHHFKAYNSHSKNNKLSDKHSERAIAYQKKAKAYADKTNMHKAIADD